MRWSPLLLLLAACSTPRNLRVPATYDDGLVWVTLLPPARDGFLTGSLPCLVENRTDRWLDVVVTVRLLDESEAELRRGVAAIRGLGPRERRRAEAGWFGEVPVARATWGEVLVVEAQGGPEPRFTSPR